MNTEKLWSIIWQNSRLSSCKTGLDFPLSFREAEIAIIGQGILYGTNLSYRHRIIEGLLLLLQNTGLPNETSYSFPVWETQTLETCRIYDQYSKVA